MAINWDIYMNATNLTRQESHVVYHGVLQVQLGYSPGTNIFTKIQLQPIQTIIDQAYKPKIGLNRNIPTTVLQGPLEFNGISTISLIITQDYKQTQPLVVFLLGGFGLSCVRSCGFWCCCQ